MNAEKNSQNTSGPNRKPSLETPTEEHSVLFVCLGNICRSPAAEEIFRTIVTRNGDSDRFEIDSAGTYSGHAGDLPDMRMRTAAFGRGYRLTHRARPVRRDDFERFDTIVSMDDSIYEALHRLAPDRRAAERIVRMTDYCRHNAGVRYVPDPYYEGPSGFELVLDLLEDACEGLYDSLRKDMER